MGANDGWYGACGGGSGAEDTTGAGVAVVTVALGTAVGSGGAAVVPGLESGVAGGGIAASEAQASQAPM
jgi:hypothetical protein